MKVYIWGTGKYGRKVLRMINTEMCSVEGFIDNNPEKRGKSCEGIRIFSYRDIAEGYDFLIVSIVEYEAVLYQLKLEGNTDFSKVIVFFDETYCDDPVCLQVIDGQKWKIALLEEKVERLERIVKAGFHNIGYEIIDKYMKNLYQFPQMGSTEEAIDKMVNEGCSLVRYGDGEFETIAGRDGTVYQKHNPELARRLAEILTDRDEKLLIGIANNYGTLEEYTEDAANSIRFYMNEATRKFHMSILEMDRVYYDAYMFKTYFGHKNREDTWKRVALVKKIWSGRDVVIVEGDKTRTGYGNDLLDNVKSLRRILAPTSNAFDKYTEILNAALKLEKDCLILVVLGQTANLLVYDLMKKGYQAVDIGQVDMDYQWYRMGAQKRMPIPDRYVSQLPPAEIEEINDAGYLNQVIERIC